MKCEHVLVKRAFNEDRSENGPEMKTCSNIRENYFSTKLSHYFICHLSGYIPLKFGRKWIQID